MLNVLLPTSCGSIEKTVSNLRTKDMWKQDMADPKATNSVPQQWMLM
jgi:hypothetical protein